MRFSANAAQAIKYEKRRGKSSAKRNGMNTAGVFVTADWRVLDGDLLCRQPIAYGMGG